MKLLYLAFISTFTLAASQSNSLKTTKDYQSTAPGQIFNSEDVRKKFVKWKFEHNKTYDGNGEESKALQKFENNNKAIELHNQRNNETFKRGLNEHSDLTYEEKKVMRMGFKQSHDSQSKIKSSSLRRKRSDQPLPDSIDYRSKFTAIKDQKKCGACWAFAANAVLEYQIAVIRNLSVQLSEQELISCDKNNTGCNGGDPFMAYGYVIQNGLASQKDYAKPGVSKECLNKRVKRTTKITDACFVSLGGDDESLKWLVANYGAVVVVICATDAFTNYKSGVYYEKNCPTNASKANHAIVIVGYGTNPVYGNFWLVRNSWGTSWGLNGYGKFARGNNTCGIANFAILPCNTNV